METVHSTKAAAAIAFVCLLAVLQVACGSRSSGVLGRQKTPTVSKLSREEVRGQLIDFGEFSRGRINQAGTELEENLQTARATKTVVQMRARLNQAVIAMLNQPDAVASFVELWGLTVRLRIFFVEGEGARFFGDYQHIAVDAMKDMEEAIESIGASLLDEELMDITRGNIMEFARANPVTGFFSNLVVFAVEVRPDTSNPFVSVLSIPMAPFRAMEGVPRTAKAISDFTATAERFSDVVSRLPESARWQMLLLLYDLEETEMAESLLESMSLFAESAARLTQVAEELPSRLREELVLLADETDEKIEGIREALSQAERTTASVERALEKVTVASSSLEGAAEGVTETARAWQSAAQATATAAQDVKTAFPADEKSEPSLTAEDVRDIAEEITRAATELRRLTAEVRELTEARDLSSLTSHFAWRAIQIVLAVFVLAFLYKLAVGLLPPRAPKGADKSRGQEK